MLFCFCLKENTRVARFVFVMFSSHLPTTCDNCALVQWLSSAGLQNPSWQSWVRIPSTAWDFSSNAICIYLLRTWKFVRLLVDNYFFLNMAIFLYIFFLWKNYGVLLNNSPYQFLMEVCHCVWSKHVSSKAIIFVLAEWSFLKIHWIRAENTPSRRSSLNQIQIW